MSLQQFLLQRAETIRQSQAIDIRARNVLVSNLRNILIKTEEIEVFIPCAECVYLFLPDNRRMCSIDPKASCDIPDEVQVFGCGKGEIDDIPF